jgi:hypothetical protein
MEGKCVIANGTLGPSYRGFILPLTASLGTASPLRPAFPLRFPARGLTATYYWMSGGSISRPLLVCNDFVLLFSPTRLKSLSPFNCIPNC